MVGFALLDKVLLNVGGGVAFMDLFNFEMYPLTLVLATVFGLTPGLLVDRLKAYTRQYQADMASTSATGGKQVAQQVGHPA